MTMTLRPFVPRETANLVKAILEFYASVCGASAAGPALAELDGRDLFVTYDGRKQAIGLGRIGAAGHESQVLEAVECNPDDRGRFGLMLWTAASSRGTTAH